MILAFVGGAGVGKDTAGDYLVKEHRFVKIAFADPMKRFCKDIFDFTFEQLWGPSSERNKPDHRYPVPCEYCRMWGGEEPRGYLRSAGENVECSYCKGSKVTFLSPRIALQTLGTEWGRKMFENVWVDYAMKIAKVIEDGADTYEPATGLKRYRDYSSPGTSVIITDCRFPNEMKRIREKGGKIIKLFRDWGEETGKVGIANHASENSLSNVPDSAFDLLLRVPEGLDLYYRALNEAIYNLTGS